MPVRASSAVVVALWATWVGFAAGQAQAEQLTLVQNGRAAAGIA